MQSHHRRALTKKGTVVAVEAAVRVAGTWYLVRVAVAVVVQVRRASNGEHCKKLLRSGGAENCYHSRAIRHVHASDRKFIFIFIFLKKN